MHRLANMEGGVSQGCTLDQNKQTNKKIPQSADEFLERASLLQGMRPYLVICYAAISYEAHIHTEDNKGLGSLCLYMCAYVCNNNQDYTINLRASGHVRAWRKGPRERTEGQNGMGKEI